MRSTFDFVCLKFPTIIVLMVYIACLPDYLVIKGFDLSIGDIRFYIRRGYELGFFVNFLAILTALTVIVLGIRSGKW